MQMSRAFCMLNITKCAKLRNPFGSISNAKETKKLIFKRHETVARFNSYKRPAFRQYLF